MPLSRESSALLKSIQEYSQAQDFIISAPRNGEMFSDMLLTTIFKHMHK